MTWPPTYTIKIHPRARNVKLKASIKKGLEVVTPPRFNPKNIPAILEQNKQWILKHLEKIQERVNQFPYNELPTEFDFKSIQKKFSIHYIASDNKKIQIFVRHQQEIVIVGNIKNKLLCKKLLEQWVRGQAKAHLSQILHKLSEETKLIYKKVGFRNQETRWGSCSADKSISLNYKLIFLPFHLVRHILIHELCHTVHLNHSQGFWKLVASFDPNWREHHKEIRRFSLT